MSVTLNLISDKEGEIKQFLDRYYEKDSKVDEDVGEWAYIYHKPLDAIDLISVFMDNDDLYNMSLWIKVGCEEARRITQENHNDIIKAIFHVFYQIKEGFNEHNDECNDEQLDETCI